MDERTPKEMRADLAFVDRKELWAAIGGVDRSARDYALAAACERFGVEADDALDVDVAHRLVKERWTRVRVLLGMGDA